MNELQLHNLEQRLNRIKDQSIHDDVMELIRFYKEANSIGTERVFSDNEIEILLRLKKSFINFVERLIQEKYPKFIGFLKWNFSDTTDILNYSVYINNEPPFTITPHTHYGVTRLLTPDELLLSKYDTQIFYDLITTLNTEFSELRLKYDLLGRLDGEMVRLGIK